MHSAWGSWCGKDLFWDVESFCGKDLFWHLGVLDSIGMRNQIGLPWDSVATGSAMRFRVLI